MKSYRWLIYLCCLGGLVVGGCAPSETAPLVVTRPIAQTTVTVVTANPTNTAPSAATPTLTAITPSPAATDPAMPTWTREPSPTPTVTATPTATPPPLAGPIWQILFTAKPCPDNSIVDSHGCALGSSALDFVRSEQYVINSHGGNFKPLSESGIFLADYDYFTLPRQPFSFDNNYVAYETLDCIYVSDLAGENPICMISRTDYPSDRGFEFWPDSNCLVIYIQSPEVPYAQVSLKKMCPEDSAPEEILVVDFPNLVHTTGYHLAPQGDALLSLGFVENEIRAYVQELGGQTPPQLLFPRPDLTFPGTWPVIRWQSDGEAIDLFFIREAATFMTISRDGDAVIQGMTLNDFYPFGGSWSPDGTQFVFSHAEADADKSGLYVVDLQSSEWRQILSGYTTGIAGNIRTWIID